MGHGPCSCLPQEFRGHFRRQVCRGTRHQGNSYLGQRRQRIKEGHCLARNRPRARMDHHHGINPPLPCKVLLTYPRWSSTQPTNCSPRRTLPRLPSRTSTTSTVSNTQHQNAQRYQVLTFAFSFPHCQPRRLRLLSDRRPSVAQEPPEHTDNKLCRT